MESRFEAFEFEGRFFVNPGSVWVAVWALGFLCGF